MVNGEPMLSVLVGFESFLYIWECWNIPESKGSKIDIKIMAVIVGCITHFFIRSRIYLLPWVHFFIYFYFFHFRLPKTITLGQYLLGTISFTNNPLAKKVVSYSTLCDLFHNSIYLLTYTSIFFNITGLLSYKIHSFGNTEEIK